MTPRLEDWPIHLRALLARRRRMPFRYGLQDCCQLARAALAAQTGVDPAAAWKLRPYRSHTQAAAELARLGGLEALPALAGLVEVPVALAARGDIVLLRYEVPLPQFREARIADKSRPASPAEAEASRLVPGGEHAATGTPERDGLPNPLRLAALGVCDGVLSAFPGKRGLLFRPTLECARAWSATPQGGRLIPGGEHAASGTPESFSS